MHAVGFLQSVPKADLPPSPPARVTQVVEHFFRHETGRLHGALTRLFGPGNLSLAEDVTQGALLQALRTWSIGGIPDNPSAWITRVAINLARDALRHRTMSSGKEASIITHLEVTTPGAPGDYDEAHEIRDDALRLMFVCSHPSIPLDAQAILALKVLCGFNNAEIARAFLSTESAIEKQLTRTKLKIKESNIPFEIPEGTQLGERLDGVLATLYLLFNEGYKASVGDRLLREELCQESVRLMTLLIEHPAGNTPRSHALLALMLLTAARFPSRTDEQGELLTLEDQDRSKWSQPLISEGMRHLDLAASGREISEYHLQAGIAACHCLALDAASTDWIRILAHYDELHRLRPTPIVALNRAVALANVDGPDAGLVAIANIPQREKLNDHHLLHAVVGELHWRRRDHAAAAASFRKALKLTAIAPEQLHLTRMLARAQSGADSITDGLLPVR